ncbi:hypothetical protein [Pseudoxanthomonas sp.]|jgi:hypothetical protein|uniref:hypothetical protein n=1 Tax=Pseudoxanthomonas sp. TaxID=1871049 RepID=UPI002FE208B4
MKVLNESEVALVSGGKADFSGMTVRVDSTEKLVQEKTFLQKVAMLAPGMFR